MKTGFLDALRHAAVTGEMPTDESLQPSLEDQLVQSLAHEQVKRIAEACGIPAPLLNRRPSTSTYSTGSPSATASPTPAGAGSAGVGKGSGQTLEELFGDLPTPEGRIAVQQLVNTAAAAVVASVESPSLGQRARVARTVPRGQKCPACEGLRWVGGQPCAQCAGRGRVFPPGPTEIVDSPLGGAAEPSTAGHLETPVAAGEIAVPVAESAEQRLEAALAREVDVPLPLVETGTLEVGDEVDPALVGGVVAPPASLTALTYDLPITLDELPTFCYAAGPAGTGKTFWAKALAAGDPEGCILAATTGIAAVNLGEGTTINSLLRFFDTNSLREAFTGGWLEGQFVRLRKAGLRRILLDEVSMLDGDQLTILCRAIDNVNQQRGPDDCELGLILVGDFAQLPPVRAPFAFESAEWDRFKDQTFRLQTVRRQSDKDFIAALQAVRRGDALKALEFFRSRIQATTAQEFNGPTILAKNDTVEKYNQLRLDKVLGEKLSFTSTRWGRLRPEWGGPPKPKHAWDIPEVLTLKVGARVMMLANRNLAEKGSLRPDYAYTNGDLGTVLGAEHGECRVKVDRTGDEINVIPVTRENLIPLEPGRRKELKAEGKDGNIAASGKHEVVGAITYVPIRLCYATSVHKSQGLSLDMVQVNIRDSFFSQPGMLYVALSRARTAEGLRLVGTPEGFRARCSVHKKVLPYL